MYLQMKLRHYDCVDCGTPCKSTSPNAAMPEVREGVGEGGETGRISGGDTNG